MSNLQHFKSKRKVNPELARRYEFDASYHGDKNIKKELASARRTATSLAKARATFIYLLPEQKLALDAAINAMRSLSKDLAELALWAGDYHSFCVVENERVRVETLEKMSDKRWGNSADALNFEVEILKELKTKEGECALGDWFHGRGQHKEVAREQFSLTSSHPESNKEYSLKLNTAAILELIYYAKPHKSNAYGGKWWYMCGWQDYEDYLAWRKTVAGAASTAILNVQSTVRN
jgi:hypothetical protein